MVAEDPELASARKEKKIEINRKVLVINLQTYNLSLQTYVFLLVWLM